MTVAIGTIMYTVFVWRAALQDIYCGWHACNSCLLVAGDVVCCAHVCAQHKPDHNLPTNSTLFLPLNVHQGVREQKHEHGEDQVHWI